MTNIQGKTHHPMKINREKDLHECCNCGDCLCEELCKKHEDDTPKKSGAVKA